MTVQVSNNAAAALASSITNTATSLTVQSGQGALFPTLAAGQFFFATLVDASNNLEIVKVTARATDTLTIARGQDGTTAKAYAAGDKIELRLVAAIFQEFIQRDGGVAFTGQITVPQGTAAGKAINADRQILTSSNLTGGGNLTADRTLDLSDTGVVAGVKGSASQIPVITVDAKGRVTSLTGVALDLSTKVDLNGANATGTWGGTTEWTRVNNRPTALNQFTNNLGNYGGWVPANTKYVQQNAAIGRYAGNQGGNCGNIPANCRNYLNLDTGSGMDFYYYSYNCSNCNCNCCCCC